MYHLNSIIPNTGNPPSLWTREVEAAVTSNGVFQRSVEAHLDHASFGRTLGPVQALVHQVPPGVSERVERVESGGVAHFVRRVVRGLAMVVA